MSREPFARRVVRLTDRSSGCWLWLGAQSFDGYGRTSVGGRDVQAHRASYEHHVGPVPAGLVIDHRCRNRLCVNPEHLEPVTPKENACRGAVPIPKGGRCRRGHLVPKGGRCLTCRAERQHESYLRKRDGLAAWEVA